MVVLDSKKDNIFWQTTIWDSIEEWTIFESRELEKGRKCAFWKAIGQKCYELYANLIRFEAFKHSQVEMEQKAHIVDPRRLSSIYNIKVLHHNMIIEDIDFELD